VALWTTGRLEQRAIEMRKQLLTLQYDVLPADYDRVERSVQYGSSLPWFAALAQDIRGQRATSTYWRRDYQSLTLTRDVGGTIIERSPSILLMAANAAFRRTQLDGSDRSAIERLNDVLFEYAEVIKQDPQNFDAAYNYEFTARTRDALAHEGGRRAAAVRDQKIALGSAVERTIHGRSGAPPPGSDMREFKILVPQRSDERKQQPDAGTGGPKTRKG
jgi:hypothetical protein